MANLKHTVVAMIAVVMISSLVAAQASEFSADVSTTNTQATQVQTVTTETTENKEEKTDNAEAKAEEAAPAAEEAQAAPAAEANVGYVLVSEGSLNVRSAANTDSEILNKLNCADKVTILSDEGEWYKVSYGEENKEGYVSKASITMSYDEAKAKALETTMYETGKAVVSEGALNIRCGAGTDFAVVDQVDNGDTLVIVAKEGEWLKVFYGRNYETGYVIASSVNIDGMTSRDEIAEKKSERIAASAKSKGVISISSGAVNVRSTPSEDAEVLTQLSNKTNVLIMSTSNGWTKIAYGSANTIGYVKSSYVTDANAVRSNLSSRSSTARSSSSSSSSSKKVVDSAPATGSTKGQALVNEAAKYLGTRYVYGGSSPSGFDCSGLVQYACRKQGISVGRSSRDQFRNGVSVSRENLQPGDLVFFGSGGRVSHVGIYAGGGQMIHSPQTGKTVCYTSINSTSRQRSYMGARRVV